MPPAKVKPSEVAAEAKRMYIPFIEQRFPHSPSISTLYPDSYSLLLEPSEHRPRRLRVAVIDGDPVDVALDWNEHNRTDFTPSPESSPGGNDSSIPIVNMANEKRAGGDWESGLIAPEECLCRRTNLYHTLITPGPNSKLETNYPIPATGGLYSPNVVVFRSGANKGYTVWNEFKSLPVISVPPVRRPKLDETGRNYSFKQEEELMKSKIRTVLRIAAHHRHKNLCMGAFGVGPSFRNPVARVAAMWRDILFTEPEFRGQFANIVFAIEKSSTNGEKGLSDFDIFEEEMQASKIVPIRP